MNYGIVCLYNEYKGIDSNLVNNRRISRRKCNDNSEAIGYCSEEDNTFFVYKDKFDEFLSIILRYDEILLNMPKDDKNSFIVIYDFYRQVKKKIPCEFIITNWKPVNLNDIPSLEFSGIDLCEKEYESLLSGGDHKLFQNEEDALHYMSELSNVQLGGEEWYPLYVYKICEQDDRILSNVNVSYLFRELEQDS